MNTKNSLYQRACKSAKFHRSKLISIERALSKREIFPPDIGIWWNKAKKHRQAMLLADRIMKRHNSNDNCELCGGSGQVLAVTVAGTMLDHCPECFTDNFNL